MRREGVCGRRGAWAGREFAGIVRLTARKAAKAEAEIVQCERISRTLREGQVRAKGRAGRD